MRYLLIAIGVLCPLFTLQLGKFTQHRTDVAAQAKLDAAPAGMIGIYNCDGWVGTVIVTGGGEMHPTQALSEKEAVEYMKAYHIDKPGHTLHIFPLGGQCAPKATT